MTPDSESLRQFAHASSEAAFAEIVRRHVNLVYSAALRQVNHDSHLAQDVGQTVFTDLARKAGSLAGRKNLAGWLYTSTHFAAAKLIRTETRRRNREEKFMREPDQAGRVTPCAPDNEWQKLSTVLDDAMHELKETCRTCGALISLHSSYKDSAPTALGKKDKNDANFHETNSRLFVEFVSIMMHVFNIVARSSPSTRMHVPGPCAWPQLCAAHRAIKRAEPEFARRALFL